MALKILGQACGRGAGILGMLLLAGVSMPSFSQGFPNRSVTLIYPFTAGSVADVAFRRMALEASKFLGQQVIYENRPGGNGRVGLNVMMNARGDGYTLCIANLGMLVLEPLADPSLKVEPIKDYVPVVQVLETFLVLAAHPSVPYRDMKGLVAFASANPGRVTAGVTGGSVGPLALELLRLSSGANITPVRYKGDANAVQDALAGRVDLLIGVAGALRANREQGKLVGIAALGSRRVKLVPDVPTAQEQGFPVSAPNWSGIVAPAGTPQEALSKLSVAFRDALAAAEVRERMESIGVEVATLQPEQFLAMIVSERDRLSNLVKQSGIKLTD